MFGGRDGEWGWDESFEKCIENRECSPRGSRRNSAKRGDPFPIAHEDPITENLGREFIPSLA
jgi:hypothetical protein